MTKQEKDTIDYYNKNAEQWIRLNGFLNQRQSVWADKLRQFNQYLPSGSILELGCGGGEEVQGFLNFGYDYTGLDAAGALIKLLTKQFPEIPFIHKTLDQLDSLTNNYDGFWCVAVFLHVPKKSILSVLQAIKRRIKIGGVGFIALLVGNENFYDAATGRSFVLYEVEEFKELLIKSDFLVMDHTIRSTHFKRLPAKHWQTYFVKA